MPTAKQRFDSRVQKQAISTMETIIKKLKAGRMEIKNQGFWRSMPGHYSFKIDVINLEEIHDSSEDVQE